MKPPLLFIDIETVSEFEKYEELPQRFQKLWQKKASILRIEDVVEAYRTKAGIYAEFAKVVTIALGYVYKAESGRNCLRVTSFTSENELQLLTDFQVFLSEKFDNLAITFCAHNGKEFDFPFLARRFLINNLKIPSSLDVRGKKPWEIPHLDTLELWKFGDYKNYTSLETLATVFNVPTSKDGIDGSQVRDVYYNEKDLKRIEMYCQDDVIVTVQVFRKLYNKQLIAADRIFRV